MTDFRAEMRCRLPNGEVRWFYLFLHQDGLKTVISRFDGLEMDITEQKCRKKVLELNATLEQRVLNAPPNYKTL